MSRSSIQEVSQKEIELKDKVVSAVEVYLWTLNCSRPGMKLDKKSALTELEDAYFQYSEGMKRERNLLCTG